MNVFEMEKEFNYLMKQGQELIEKLKNTQDITLRNNMKEYTIIFNGKPEKWVVSDNTMTFDKAQEWINRQGGTPSTVGDLWAVDVETKKPRWLLLKEAGYKEWVWCDVDPEEVGRENPCIAYRANLGYGGVYGFSRFNFNYALCRVGF